MSFDPVRWDELCPGRFIDAGRDALILGPIGVGKTFMASLSAVQPCVGASSIVQSGRTRALDTSHFKS